jgi:hypothetical protein
MKNVQAMIDLFGGLASFRHVRLECAGFMPLAGSSSQGFLGMARW